MLGERCFSFYVPLGLSMRTQSKERNTIIKYDDNDARDVVRFFWDWFSEMALKIEKDYADVATTKESFRSLYYWRMLRIN